MKITKQLVLSLLLGFIFLHSNHVAVIDTVDVFSNSMNKNLRAIVVKPDNYSELHELPVVYLLHGYSGNYLDWIKKGNGFET